MEVVGDKLVFDRSRNAECNAGMPGVGSRFAELLGDARFRGRHAFGWRVHMHKYDSDKITSRRHPCD